ncbi:MAG: hypothetical protein MZV70_60155 [Desulfobacterales bacterium]|nr:hypothetical protein [Desulfobacterales bacterium]
MDIPDSILHAGAAAAQAAAYLEKSERGSPDGREEAEKIGVYICHCGGNISDHVDVEEVRRAHRGAVRRHRGPDLHVHLLRRLAERDDQGHRGAGPRRHGRRLLLAQAAPDDASATSPTRAGLNPFQYVQVNIREQCSWAHSDDHEGAT